MYIIYVNYLLRFEKLEAFAINVGDDIDYREETIPYALYFCSFALVVAMDTIYRLRFAP